MQQYTRQQLIGHVRYSPSSLMGNWSEEVELKRTVLKDFLQKKETGTLQVDRCATQQHNCATPRHLLHLIGRD